jgi:hypothetical protein
MDKDPVPSSRPDPEKTGETPSSDETLDHAAEEAYPAGDAVSDGPAWTGARRREREHRRKRR